MIKIRPTEESAKINVTSTIDSGSVSAYDSAGIFFADLAKKWAISDSLVQNTDYSSKYYAEQSKTSSALAEAKLGEIEDFVLDAKSDIQQDKNNVLAEIDSACENAVESIVFAGDTKVSQVNTTANSKISEMNDIVDDVNAIKTQTQQYMLNASSSADDAASDAQTAIGAKNAVLNAISGYGDIVTHNVSEFATSIQGQKADSALQSISSANVTNALGYTPVNPSDLAVVATSGNYNDLTNKPSIPEGVIVDQTYNASSTNAQSGTAVAGAISGKQNTLVSGTNIKTINNTSLLGSGNVAVQPTLVSGTNIKTVNNTSLLGSGNIDTSEVFVAEYGVTSFADIETAYNAGKAVFCKTIYELYVLVDCNPTAVRFSSIYGNETTSIRLLKNPASGSGWTSTYSTLQYKNLVTSLSSSSTDTQYPSAKCVYDLTESNRFDGQWVQSYLTVFGNVAVGSYSASLSSYLPDDNYSYEIMLEISLASANTTHCYVGTTASPHDNWTRCFCVHAATVSASTRSRNTSILPIGTSRMIYEQISGAKASTDCNVYLIGYRRLGTNT